MVLEVLLCEREPGKVKNKYTQKVWKSLAFFFVIICCLESPLSSRFALYFHAIIADNLNVIDCN